MSLRIKTNVSSLVAQRHLRDSTQQLQKTMEKLSSGQRINKAADDAAGLAISENLRADIRALGQAQRNTNDGISLLQVAEGSLNEITNIMVRLKELAVQGASDTIGDKERGYLNQEFMALKDEVDRIAVSTEFNGSRLIVGTTQLPPSLATLQQGPPLEIQVDKKFNIDTDAPDNPHPVNIIKLDFSSMNAMTEGTNSLDIGNSQNEGGTRVDSKVGAQESIHRLDLALEKVASHRALFGSLQSRLTSTSKNLGIKIENLADARSRIVDADFASETANMTQSSILQQAGAAVLAQANQLPQLALKLLE